MPSFKESKIVEHRAEEMFELVMDVEKYPEFIPWCKVVKITKEIDENCFEADVLINFKGMFEKYKSHVSSKKDGVSYFIEVRAIEGPFKYLINEWSFRNLEVRDGCNIEFFIDFKFNSIFLEKLLSPIFSKATKKMVDAFINRANDVFKA